jgi:hypothetical protein
MNRMEVTALIAAHLMHREATGDWSDRNMRQHANRALAIVLMAEQAVMDFEEENPGVMGRPDWTP